MARNLLTVAEIKASTRTKLRDGEGLWLHSAKAGSRHWVFIFVRQGRRREMGLGRYGAGTGSVGLAAARTKADEIRTILGRGGDPFVEMEERKRRVSIPNFGKIVDEYIETMQSQWRGRQTLPAWERFANTYTRALRNIPVNEIDTDAVVRTVLPFWDEKPETATKIRERLKIVLDHAKARGFRVGDNPAQWKGHLDQMMPSPKRLVRGHHPSMPYVDMPAYIAKLRAHRGVAAMALEFVILTASRSGEVRGATIDEIDLAAKTWTVPASRMKEQREHRVPLCDRAMELIRTIRGTSINNILFPSPKLGRPLSDAALGTVMKATGASAYVVHGFRSSFRDFAAEETNHQREVAEAALSHAVGNSVERAYRRGDALAKRRLLMDDWAKFLEGDDGQAAAN